MINPIQNRKIVVKKEGRSKDRQHLGTEGRFASLRKAIDNSEWKQLKMKIYFHFAFLLACIIFAYYYGKI